MKQSNNMDREKRIVFFSRKPVAIVTLSCFVLFGVLFAGYFLPLHPLSNVHASEMVKLPGQLPPLVKQSQVVSSVDGSTPITIVIGLHLRNADGLAQYVKSVSQPKDTTKRTLSPAQITEAYSPLPSSDQAVIDYMQQIGFQTTKTFNNHLLLGFGGTVAQAEQAFNVQLNNYQSKEGRTFYAPSTDPSIPANIAPLVESINGLDNAVQMTHVPVSKLPHITKSASTQLQPNVTSASNSNICQTDGPNANNLNPPQSYFSPSQVASGYNLSTLYNEGFHGEGQTVGLFELSDYNTGDISAYTANCGVGGSIPVTRVQPAGSVPHDSRTMEANLDIELLTSAAPRLAGIAVYEAPNTYTNALLLWEQIVGNAVPVVSTSWGTCETSLPANYAKQENDLFTIAAAQGQSIFAASGDLGSDSCGVVPTNAAPNPLNVIDPASQPYVTAVGGTQLTLDGSNNYAAETTWNDAKGAGGGGISSVWTKPAWQNAPGVPDATYSSGTPCSAPTGQLCREVPDVSLQAGGQYSYLIYCSSSCNTATANPSNWWLIDGTSAAAPLWAAMTALANQKSLSKGFFNLGFLNPMLYQIGSNATEYANDFHDITTGNNNIGINNQTQYPATPGYDMATGLGSYNAANLADNLISIAATKTGTSSAPANTTWYFAEGSVGGSFIEYITLLNPNPTQTANVSIQYLFQNKSEVTIPYTVAPSTRHTVGVNSDLNIPANAPQQSISAIVTSDVPIVAERPMYFNWFGINSGTDVLGSTNATNTTFYFAQGDHRNTSSMKSSEFLTILNPSSTTAALVTAKYFSGGSQVGSDTVTISPLHRGTLAPGYLGQAAIELTSSIGIVAERPTYINENIPTAGGSIIGAASTVGATALGNDWLFAEGHTGDDFQEYIVLGNFTTSNTTAAVKLEYPGGKSQTINVTVPALSQFYFNVNSYYSSAYSTDVSVEVTTPTASIVAERVLYFKYLGQSQYAGMTDVVGEAGPSSHSVYSFAEGFTGGTFQEWLTLQNPTSNAEVVAVTLFANKTIIEKEITLQPTSRTTVGINSLVVPMANAYPNPSSPSEPFVVSMNVQVLGNGTVVAERPMYFNFAGSHGGTDIIGYTGN